MVNSLYHTLVETSLFIGSHHFNTYTYNFVPCLQYIDKLLVIMYNNLINDKRGFDVLVTNDIKVVKKIWLSPVKEAQWLNSMAEKGLYLQSRSFMTYKFSEFNAMPKNCVYSVHYFDTAPFSESSVEYINSRKDSELVCTYANYGYFITPSDDSDTLGDDAVSNRHHIGNMLFLYGGIFLFWVCMMCYNIIQWLYFSASEYTTTNPSDFIHKITIDLTSVFGNYKTTPYISLYLMLSLLFAPMAVYYLDAYLGARKEEKALRNKADEE